MSTYYVWDDFDITFQKEALYRKCHFGADSRQAEVLSALLLEARDIARPKVAVRIMKPEFPEEGKVALDGVVIDSNLLYNHLKEETVCFPYVGTCGRELDSWAKTKSGLKEFLAAEIMIQAQRLARMAADERLCREYGLAMTSAMNPGSLPREWPIQGQIELFKIMGELPGKIGVTLLESLLMAPAKSVSGISFPTKEKFHNCDLCPKYDCPERQEE